MLIISLETSRKLVKLFGSAFPKPLNSSFNHGYYEDPTPSTDPDGIKVLVPYPQYDLYDILSYKFCVALALAKVPPLKHSTSTLTYEGVVTRVFDRLSFAYFKGGFTAIELELLNIVELDPRNV